jgi:Uroporphyrinogen-III decarboxylase
MNMKQWLSEIKAAKQKKAMPILSFPSIQLLGISVPELISSAKMQAKGMQMIAERVNAAASLSMMNLSLEAEAFGSEIRVSDDEVPTVIGRIIRDMDDAKALMVPDARAGRTGLYIDAIGIAAKEIKDRPVFAGIIGPYSLAGRLMDVSEIMIQCYEDPDMVHIVLEKVTEFLIKYAKAYKETGAHGVVIAEPLAGILNPQLIEEFSTPYVKKIVDAVQTDDFIVLYHNCGNNTIVLLDSILKTGCSAYHFGNAINMEEMVSKMPSDTIVLGNIDPSGQFRYGTPESIRQETLALLGKCAKYPNFIISSGCDIPPMSKWENIDAFFAAVDEFYKS